MSKTAMLTIATLAATLAQASASQTRITSCTGPFWSSTCVTIKREGVSDPHVTNIGPREPRSEQEIAESQHRERLWVARCKPKLLQDDFGVSRYTYAARGCDFGKYE